MTTHTTEPYTPAIWVECGADLEGNEKFPFTRKHYMFPENTYQFREAYQNRGVYQTALQYIDPIWYQNVKGRWLINAADTLKWGDFYLDFDTKIDKEEDYRKLKEDIMMAIRYLTIIMSVDLSQIRFYFSGNKGIHLTVPAQTFGLEPHIALNKIYKFIAEDIAKYCKHDTIDIRVYDDKRMFRMVNSWNIKGNAYKIPITYQEFKTLSYAEIRSLASQPREVPQASPILSPRAKLVLQQQIKEWSDKVNRKREFTGKMKELKEPPPCIKAMWEKIFRETIDERNNSATALASFYLQQDVSFEECLARVQQWNETQCVPPQKPKEIEIVVESVYNGQYRYGCETFKRVSGVCEKDKCPIFHRA